MDLLNFQMPGMDTPEGQGLMAAAFSLLGARKIPGERGIAGALGQAGQQYMGARGQAVEAAQRKTMQELQMQGQRQQMEAQRMQMEEQRRADAQRRQMEQLAGRFQIPGTAGYGANEMDSEAVPAKPAGYDFQGYANALAGVNPSAAISMLAALQKDDKPLTVAEGTTLIDPKTMKPVFSNPKAEKPAAVPTSLQEYEFARSQGYKGTFEQWDTARKRAGASSVSVNTGQKGFDNTLKLRGDFRSEPIYKAHEEVKSAYSQIQQGLKMGSPAGDLAGATKVMKLLDPGSVVRESELGMAMAATGMLDRLSNYGNMVMTGQKLTPLQRKDFQALADALFNESAKQYNAKRGEYADIAKRNELNIPDVVGAESTPRATMRWNAATGKLEQVK